LKTEKKEISRETNPILKTALELINQIVKNDSSEFEHYAITINFSAMRAGEDVTVKNLKVKAATLEDRNV